MPEETKALGWGVFLDYSRVRARQCDWVSGWRWSVSKEVGEVAEVEGLCWVTVDDG